jgi:hypothetical protein
VKTSENPCLNNDLRDLRELRGENETSNGLEKLLTPNSSPRVKLDAPVILSVTGSVNSFTVNWSAVAGAYSYTVAYSQDPTFATGAQTGIVNAPLTSYTVPGREADTLYYVRVKSYPNLPGPDTGSDYSGVQAVRTLLQMPGTAPEGDDSNVTLLQNWLNNQKNEFANIAALVPELDETDLNSTQRRRLNGSGSSRWGFINKTVDLSLEFPQFWPRVRDSEVLNERVLEIEVLRNLLVWLRYVNRVIGDLLLLAGNDAMFRASLYYGLAREGARKRNGEAVQVYNMLRPFWTNRRKKSGEPTQKKVISKAKGLQNGTLDGSLLIDRESDTVTKGDMLVVDGTYPAKPHVEVKETLSETVE